MANKESVLNISNSPLKKNIKDHVECEQSGKTAMLSVVETKNNDFI